jgi:hypothetical protein
MGRHSSSDQSFFYRSAALWFLPWMLVATVAVAAVWIAIDAIGRDVESATPSRPNAGPANADAESSPSPEPTPKPTNSKPDKEKKEKKEEPKPPALITKGVTVQVLNGSAIAGAEDAMAERLAGLGYEIVAANPYLSQPESVVYWSSDEWKKAAVALAQRFGWNSGPKPADLSSEVSIHVIVGPEQ